jgi:hypothetical protein
MIRVLRYAGLAAVLALPLMTCDTYTATRLNAPTRIYLTDAPFPYHRVARVDLWVVSVSGTFSEDTSVNGSFFTLAAPNRRINVLALQNGLHDELGSVAIPSGIITAVRMVIDTDSSSITLKSGAVLTGKTNPGIQWQSSAGRPVLNALVNEQIGIPLTGGLVVIDFDVGQAFIAPQELDPSSTDSGFIFSPVLRAVDANASGWISGIVRAQSANGAAVVDASLRLYLGTPATAENTWTLFGTAKTDSTGLFRFASLTRTAYWETIPAQAGKSYIVTVDPPPSSGLGRALVANLTVNPGAPTSVGVVVLP